MNTIKRILFPTDFSEVAQSAFQYALALAADLTASIEVIHAVAPDYMTGDFPAAAVNATQIKLETSEEVIKDFVDLGRSRAGDRTSNVLITISEAKVGNPMDIIKANAVEKMHDLIVLGTHDDKDIIDQIFGTFATNILNTAPCPLLIIPESAIYQGINNVLYASALTKGDYRPLQVIIDSLATLHPKYHVSHIDTGTDTEISLTQLSDYFVAQKPHLDITFHESSADAVDEGLENFIHTHQIDLLGMHRHYRGFFERIFHSSVTKKMIFSSPVPILIHKSYER